MEHIEGQVEVASQQFIAVGGEEGVRWGQVWMSALGEPPNGPHNTLIFSSPLNKCRRFLVFI
jgi:hypothetical protein